MPNFNDFQTLQTAAEAYYTLGYAVIPLLGDFDPARPKVAARAWSSYQQRLATLNEINDWFSPQGGAAALGIVTGRISRLVVLDFDSPDLFADFRRRFPDLLETRTIQSAARGLPHLYFHLPSHLRLASHKRPGIDLLSDGRYVVAPPTTINGQAYRITRGGMPHPLTEHDIQRLQSFLTAAQSRPSLPSISPSPAPLSTQWRGAGGEDAPPSASVGKGLRPFHAPVGEDAPSPVYGGGLGWGFPPASVGEGLKPSRADLHGLYRYWRTRTGRNEALFRTALYARDHGLDETQTRRTLVSLYVSTPSPAKVADRSGRRLESPAIRQREAQATIRSAFSRSPRPLLTPLSVNEEGAGVRSFPVCGLPNSVREALMQHKLTFVLRTLEGLYQVGFRPGKGFSAEQAIQSLKGIVGRDSVYNALNALAPNGQPFFPQRSPSALPPASNEAANQKQPLKTKKCFFVTGKKSGIKKRGPKQRRFKFPKLEDLCKLLGVKPSGSDLLTRDDLTSARKTRMALQRELIKRRPAEYTRRWLANRLGVSRRTLDTYNHLIPIHSRATYHETTLSWANLDNLLTDEVLAGSHIETLMGKKYPALRAVAAHLLAKGTYIRLKQRTGNFYWYGTDDPPPNILPTFSPAPLSMQWRGAGGEDVSSLGTQQGKASLSDALSALAPISNAPSSSPSVGKGLRPFHALSPASTPLSMQWRGAGGEDAYSIGTRRAMPAPFLTSPRPEGEGLGVRVPPPLPPDQAESLAQTIYTRINQSTGGTTKHFSLKNARKLVRTYAEKDIQFALKRLSQRTNLANPTGFFVTVLRSTARQT